MNPLSTIRGPHGLGGRSEGEDLAQGYACNAGGLVDPVPQLSDQHFADFFASIGATFDARPCDDETLKSLDNLCRDSVTEALPVNAYGPPAQMPWSNDEAGTHQLGGVAVQESHGYGSHPPQGDFMPTVPPVAPGPWAGPIFNGTPQSSPAMEDAFLSPNMTDFAAQDTPELCSASTPASALSHLGSPFSSESCPFPVGLGSSPNTQFFTQQLASPILFASAPAYGAMLETVGLPSTNTSLSPMAMYPGVDQTGLATTEARYEPTSSDGASSPAESSPDRPFSCTECMHQAKTKRDMERHAQTKHGTVELRCVQDDCSATFKGGRDDNLRRHMREIHKINLPNKRKGPPKGSRRAPRRPRPAATN